jgi:hypothetical protein
MAAAVAAELQLLGGLGDAADDAPDERTLALLVDPRVKVVGDQREGESGVLGPGRVAHEIARPLLFAR